MRAWTRLTDVAHKIVFIVIVVLGDIKVAEHAKMMLALSAPTALVVQLKVA